MIICSSIKHIKNKGAYYFSHPSAAHTAMRIMNWKTTTDIAYMVWKFVPESPQAQRGDSFPEFHGVKHYPEVSHKIVT